MTLTRLQQIRDYIEAMALRAEYSRTGCVKDLNDAVIALNDLIDRQRQELPEAVISSRKPMPKRTSTKAPMPKRIQ